MMFQFDSIIDFLQMNGHGIYVWLSYAAALLLLLLLAFSPTVQQRRFIIQQKRQQRIEQGVKQRNSADQK
ncbi:MAG: heme exporter protein D [Candidatus Endobugula sp.]|jgi:heme exporter protein D